MKKIAIASENGMVAGHFGHCEEFMMYEIEEGVIAKVELVKNPPHEHGFLPSYLNDLKVNTVIAGGIGAGAIEKFLAFDIEVIPGITGDVKEVINNYLEGKLEPAKNLCEEKDKGHMHEHEHHHEHGGHCHK